ncbi:hypothetical protein HOT32_gp34 [Erwinia phage Faunus]|uniref:Uncharacterized protein n=1 Tax=Erwinia phage Faunus TaxID=2182346 RepID=A0A2U8UWX1_9CAUD|nr:hypothetical protein HOT32_gp34 [Erwinia phage Faunus]AWN08617.1 hypothetical protein [Erwinia phage Faunus]
MLNEINTLEKYFMNNLVSSQALQMMAENKDINLEELRDKVALVAFNALLTDAAKHYDSSVPIKEIVARAVWDFADEFMRERYERECVLRVNLQPNQSTRPGDIPPDLDLLNN